MPPNCGEGGNLVPPDARCSSSSGTQLQEESPPIVTDEEARESERSDNPERDAPETAHKAPEQAPREPASHPSELSEDRRVRRVPRQDFPGMSWELPASSLETIPLPLHRSRTLPPKSGPISIPRERTDVDAPPTLDDIPSMPREGTSEDAPLITDAATAASPYHHDEGETRTLETPINAGFDEMHHQTKGILAQDSGVNTAWLKIESAIESATNAVAISSRTNWQRILEFVLLGVILIAGAAARLFRLDESPPGIQWDEALWAIESLKIANGQLFGFWHETMVGQPTGPMYWQALFFLFNGSEFSVLAMRLATATAGVASIFFAYLLVRRQFGVPIALTVAFFISASFFSIVFSRIAFPPIYATLAILAAMWLLLRTFDHRQLWLGILAGAIFGMGLWAHKGYVALFIPMWIITAIIVAAKSDLRQRPELKAFLAVSSILSIPFFYIIFATDYLDINLNGFYNEAYSGNASSLLNVQGHAERVLDVILMVQNPTNQAYSIDAVQGIPFLFGWFIPLFWIGLAVTLLSLRQRRYQLFMLCWMIAIPSIVIFVDNEPRRYLLGIYCLYTFIAIALYFLMGSLFNMIKWALRGDVAFSGSTNVAVATKWTIVAVCLFAFGYLFIQETRKEYDVWNRSQEVTWFFRPEIKDMFDNLHEMGDFQRICVYSSEHYGAFDFPMSHLIAPGLQVVKGAVQHGGDGTLASCTPVETNTAIVLFQDHMHLEGELESTFPGGMKRPVSYSRLDHHPNIEYVLYLAPSS